MKLTLRFVILVVALVAAVGASAYTGHAALARLDGALTTIVAVDVERLLAITHARRLFRSMVVQERDHILAKSAAERAPMDEKMASLATQLLEQIDKYAGLMPPDDARVVGDIRGVRERWLQRDIRVREAARRDQNEALQLAKAHAADPVSWEKAIGELVERSETRLAEEVRKTHAVFLDAQSQLLVVSAGAGILACVLGGMIFMGIRKNLADVVRLNTNLEAQIRARTESLTQRERSLRLVLDSTGDGLLEVGRDGCLTGTSSAAAERWFGHAQPGVRLEMYLHPLGGDPATALGIAFEQLVEEILPWELCRDQMPKRLARGGQILELDWKRVLENGAFTKLLVIARDVTDTVHSERAEQTAREQQNLIKQLLQDKAGFFQFVKDGEALLSSLETGHDPVSAQRNLHTLKGNAGLFGLTSIAVLCHTIEDRIAAEASAPSASEVADLAALWRTRMQSIESFLNDLSDAHVEMDASEHAKLLTSLLERQDYEEILSMVELLTWPRTAERMTRFRAHAEHLARRFGKQVYVELEDNGLRIPSNYLEKFWPALIHVVRNAIDHAAEPAEVRRAQGKSDAMRLVFKTEQTADSLLVEVRDDGTGIDRETLLRCARRKNPLVPESISLAELIFMDGVSSRSEVTETSGRGLGMAAVRQACDADGGSIDVLSERGKGATFRFRFRRPIVKLGALAANLERRWTLLPAELHGPAANTNSRTPETGTGA